MDVATHRAPRPLRLPVMPRLSRRLLAPTLVPISVRATFLPTPPAADHLFHDIAEYIVILRGEMKSVIFGKARYLL